MTGFFLAAIAIGLMLFCAGLYGYCANVVMFFADFGLSTKKQAAKTLIRAIGIFIFPVGIMLGYWNFNE